MGEHALEEAISLSPLLEGTDAGELAACLEACEAGRGVSDVFGGVPCLGLIVQGRVAVLADSPDGREVRMSTLRVGDCFGIANLFSSQALPTRLRCEEDTVIAYMAKDRLIDLLARNSALALRFLRINSEKIQFLIRRVQLLQLPSRRLRLAAYLLGEGREDIRFPGNRDALAAHLGMSRAALFRELSALEKEGVVSTKGTLVRVLRPDELARIVNGEEEPSPEASPFV